MYKLSKSKCLLIIVFSIINFSLFGQVALHIYGGDGHKVYLGCINCNEYSQNSVWNEYGTYGNNYNVMSIWNNYGTYGNDFSIYSPWNKYGTNPPVIVDKEGNFYGYFTVNENHGKRWESSLANIIYKYFDMIMDDVGKWYKKIFG